jgi:hypothetical protein
MERNGGEDDGKMDGEVGMWRMGRASRGGWEGDEDWKNEEEEEEEEKDGKHDETGRQTDQGNPARLDKEHPLQGLPIGAKQDRRPAGGGAASVHDGPGVLKPPAGRIKNLAFSSPAWTPRRLRP